MSSWLLVLLTSSQVPYELLALVFNGTTPGLSYHQFSHHAVVGKAQFKLKKV